MGLLVSCNTVVNCYMWPLCLTLDGKEVQINISILFMCGPAKQNGDSRLVSNALNWNYMAFGSN